jgi:hypothetical protein
MIDKSFVDGTFRSTKIYWMISPDRLFIVLIVELPGISVHNCRICSKMWASGHFNCGTRGSKTHKKFHHMKILDSVWSILVHSGSFWSILVHSGPFWFILVHFGPFWSILVLSWFFYQMVMGLLWAKMGIYYGFISFL